MRVRHGWAARGTCPRRSCNFGAPPGTVRAMCPNTASTGRHWDGSPRTTRAPRPLRVADTSPSRLLRCGLSARCRLCGNRVDLYQRTDRRPIALHPAELAVAHIPAPCRWHLSCGIAHPYGDGSDWCRIPHDVLCPHRTHPAEPAPEGATPPTRRALPPTDRHRRLPPTGPARARLRTVRREHTSRPARRAAAAGPLPRRPAARRDPVCRPDPPALPLLPASAHPRRRSRQLEAAARRPATRPTRPALSADGRLRPGSPALRRTAALAYPALHRPRRSPRCCRSGPGRMAGLRPPPARGAYPHPPPARRGQPPAGSMTCPTTPWRSPSPGPSPRPNSTPPHACCRSRPITTPPA
ncbi:DUF6083 domain-containing protein [Streptomyces bacillaris]|uniref:DUF6083 domain-containing protein n=1 Tax=Streptomyces bacillaris TaxID=68179 RepID=UPI0036FDA8CE